MLMDFAFICNIPKCIFTRVRAEIPRAGRRKKKVITQSLTISKIIIIFTLLFVSRCFVVRSSRYTLKSFHILPQGAGEHTQMPVRPCYAKA